MLILALETSCDETAAAIVKGKNNKVKVLANVVSSQVKLHARWGGVVPNLAAREHLKNIPPVLQETWKIAKIHPAQIDLMAVTTGPGLIPALLLGVNAAKALAYFWQKPLLSVQHIAGHFFSAFSSANFVFQMQPNDFPALALTVSGGHTQLLYLPQPFIFQQLGETRDDAAGEAFDKVAKILQLGYPGGPIIARYADFFQEYYQNRPEILAKAREFFPRPLLNKPNFDFSFSGLKTAVLYHVQNSPWAEKLSATKTKENVSPSDFQFPKKPDKFLLFQAKISYAFQEAVLDVLVQKTQRAGKKYPIKTLVLSGGVSANNQLRQRFLRLSQKLKVKFRQPPLELTGDNAAMIAAAAYYQYQSLRQMKKTAELDRNYYHLDADSNQPLSNFPLNLKKLSN